MSDVLMILLSTLLVFSIWPLLAWFIGRKRG